jgi:hypothetical protein
MNTAELDAWVAAYDAQPPDGHDDRDACDESWRVADEYHRPVSGLLRPPAIRATSAPRVDPPQRQTSRQAR